mmetsp:Transcript_23786/g.37190  ORF Transcript_23786/g.37190 Transcript_23786/m.37190 type:complete len:263 (-) Transcript_23786:1466-2254(-)
MENTVTVNNCNGFPTLHKIKLPDVFFSPIRIDILKYIHHCVSKNKRQPYAVSPNSGSKSSAKSWGTGRALSRVPRIPGGGTHRSGQGAIVNMCRGGRIFGPTTVWRKWSHKTNKQQRKHALAVSIACTGISALVIARGHKLNHILEIPIIIESISETLTKTKEGHKILQNCGVIKPGINKQDYKRNQKSGKGKMRNRKFKKKAGPLLVYEKSDKSFRNITNLDTCKISALNILNLAPGGHVGRLCIWTSTSFSQLDCLFPSS